MKLTLHFLSSNSRHGTHSPFVYAIAKDVVYNKRDTTGSRELLTDCDWERSPSYLELLNRILRFLSVSHLHQKKILDGAYWTSLDELTADDIKRVNSGQLLVIHEPHRNERAWAALKKHKSVTVTIDFFHFALVIKRETQRKEDFKLRYPYWKRLSS